MQIGDLSAEQIIRRPNHLTEGEGRAIESVMRDNNSIKKQTISSGAELRASGRLIAATRILDKTLEHLESTVADAKLSVMSLWQVDTTE